MSYNGRETGSINGRSPPLGQYVETADYVIFKEDGIIKAKNGSDGSIAFQDTDFATVLQDAINDAGGEAGGTYGVGGSIFIHAGDYTLSKTVTLNKFGLTIIGEGAASTQITAKDGLNANMFELTTTDLVHWLDMRHLRLDGNKANNTSGHCVYIDVDSDLKDSRFENVFFSRAQEDGLQQGKAWGCVISNSTFEANQRGIYLRSGSNAKIIGVKVNDNDGNGISCNTSESFIIGSEIADNGGDAGIYNAAESVSIIGNTVRKNNRFGIWTKDATKRVNIIGNIVWGSGQDGIRSASYGSIVGNSLWDNGRDSVDSYPSIHVFHESNIMGNYVDCNAQAQYGIDVDSGASDVKISNNNIINPATSRINDAGTRTVINGIGKNGANDPASAGDWNGYGYEGVRVKWNDGTNYYVSIYLGGTWYDIQVDSPVV